MSQIFGIRETPQPLQSVADNSDVFVTMTLNQETRRQRILLDLYSLLSAPGPILFSEARGVDDCNGRCIDFEFI